MEPTVFKVIIFAAIFLAVAILTRKVHFKQPLFFNVTKKVKR